MAEHEFFDGEVIATGERAHLVRFDEDIEVWVPYSVVDDEQSFRDSEIGDFVNVGIPRWLAESEGLL